MRHGRRPAPLSFSNGFRLDRACERSSPPPRSRIPDADGHILLLGSEKGIFETDNAGQTWGPASLPEVKLNAQAIAEPVFVLSSGGVGYETAKHPAEGYEIYGMVATDHNGFLAATSRGLMKSSEVEKAWQPLHGILDGSTVTAICKHPTRAGVIFASKFGVIFVSSDEGQSWKTLPGGETTGRRLSRNCSLYRKPPTGSLRYWNRGVYSISLPAL